MAVQKNYLKTKKNICRVTFNLPANDVAQSAFVVGDFNGWNVDATPMKKGRQGFTATVDLETGRDYQFRYLVDGQEWRNDEQADSFVDTDFGCQNCVITS